MQPMVERADLLRAIAAGVDPDGAAQACGFERVKPDDEAAALRDRTSFIDDPFYLERVRFHSDAGRSLQVARMTAYADWVERGQS